MMSSKKYTLYFKGKNEYGHEHVLPIISLSLNQMDEFTSSYNNYFELFNDLHFDSKNFIYENLCSGINKNDVEQLSSSFVIENNDGCVLDVIFNNDKDVLKITSDKLCELLLDEIMSSESFQRLQLKTKSLNKLNKQYDLFVKLYNDYIKGNSLEKMIDTYYTKRKFPCLKDDDLVIATIATDPDSIKILTKKLGQSLKNVRDVTLLLKRMKKNKNFVINEKENTIEKINTEDVLNQADRNVNEFMDKYFDEYKVIV